MKKLGSLMFALLIVGLFLGACNEGDDEGGDFTIALSGADEVCDEEGSCGGEGSGTAKVTINSDRNEICYEITLQGVAGVTAAHIHAAPEGEAGEVVVDLVYDGDDAGAEGCVDDIEEGVLEGIAEEPERHYLNVHTSDLPDGAARGQLQS